MVLYGWVPYFNIEGMVFQSQSEDELYRIETFAGLNAVKSSRGTTYVSKEFGLKTNKQAGSARDEGCKPIFRLKWNAGHLHPGLYYTFFF
jgi:hypothetical protein